MNALRLAALLLLVHGAALGADLTIRKAQPVRVEPAQTFARALDLYHDGSFAQAADLATESGLSEGLALAARALLAEALVAEDPKNRLALYRRAEALAREAIVLDEGNAEAHRLLAIAIGYIARTKSAIENWVQGSADEAKGLVDRALVLDPGSPWSHAALGGWHAEIVAAVGDLLASEMAGASLKQAKSSFRQAIALDPENPVLHFEFATALIRTRQSKYLPLARRHLALASLLQPEDAFETIIVGRAKTLREKLEGRRFDTVDAPYAPGLNPRTDTHR